MLTQKQVLDAGYTIAPKGAWYSINPYADAHGWDSMVQSLGFNPNCDEVVLCVVGFKEVWNKQPIRMRDDLAEYGFSVPASKSYADYDTQVDIVYVTAQELEGAEFGDDPAPPDDHPFTYLKLKDGRSMYFISVDLDFD